MSLIGAVMVRVLVSVKNHFFILFDDELTSLYTNSDPLIPRSHCINVVLEFINITIPTARYDVNNRVS